MPRGQYDRHPRHDDSRALEGRETETREFESEDETGPIFIDGTSGGLPHMPSIPGFHTCWIRVPTERVKDVNNVRAFLNASQYGYIAVRPSELPGYDDFKMDSAAAAGEVIQYMDVIFCKVPNARWARIQAGFDLKAHQQYESIKQVPREGNPQHRKVPVTLDRNNRPFRTVDLTDE